jgi:hypothetical protein
VVSRYAQRLVDRSFDQVSALPLAERMLERRHWDIG